MIPFADTLVLADINAGLLYILALTSLAVYGIIIAGWASNSKYAFLGAMRSVAQLVSYEIAMGFALVCVLIAAGSLNLGQITAAQNGSILHWYWLPLLPIFLVYFITGVAETNRAPFDVAEGESELVAGFHVEYGGMAFSIFFMAGICQYDTYCRTDRCPVLWRLAVPLPGFAAAWRFTLYQ